MVVPIEVNLEDMEDILEEKFSRLFWALVNPACRPLMSAPMVTSRSATFVGTFPLFLPQISSAQQLGDSCRCGDLLRCCLAWLLLILLGFL
jgi:hypothetical protein